METATAHKSTAGSATMRAVRAFLKAGGRILVTPKGELTEGGGMPRSYTHGSSVDTVEWLHAGRAYLAARAMEGGASRILRAVRLLGWRTENGWLGLEARASSNRKRGRT